MENKSQETNQNVNNSYDKTRDTFGSRLGIIAAAAGSAIGLGNIWKFPYITGVNGGAAFIVVYLACIAVIGLPVMLAEFIIGRRSQKNAVGAFKKLAPGTPWFLVGVMGVLSAFMILAYYGVVAGWTLEYIVKSGTGALAGMSPEQIESVFGGFIGSTVRPIIWQIVFMAITASIVVSGVKEGIEKYSKILMPLLLAILLILCVRSITLPGAVKGLEFLFRPDFSKLSAQGVLIALGHAFFSLSLGMGTMLTYASYIGKRESLGKIATQVTVSDTLIALLAGIAIFPAVFAFNIEPGSGPGLVFVTLPNVFNKMPGGPLFAALFFVLLAIAALTSAISILEVVVSYTVEELKMPRKRATIIATVIITLLGIPSSLAMGPMAGFKIAGLNYFDFLDWTTASILMPVGGLLITAFLGWYWGREKTREELSSEGTLKIRYIGLFMFVCKYIAPAAVAAVFLYGLFK
ncbi:MAG: sodium-dependent transporter [Bacillota bacterium]